MTFRVNRYQVIKKAVSFELANFIFNYFMLKRDAVAFLYQNNITYDKKTALSFIDLFLLCTECG